MIIDFSLDVDYFLMNLLSLRLNRVIPLGPIVYKYKDFKHLVYFLEEFACHILEIRFPNYRIQNIRGL